MLTLVVLMLMLVTLMLLVMLLRGIVQMLLIKGLLFKMRLLLVLWQLQVLKRIHRSNLTTTKTTSRKHCLCRRRSASTRTCAAARVSHHSERRRTTNPTTMTRPVHARIDSRAHNMTRSIIRGTPTRRHLSIEPTVVAVRTRIAAPITALAWMRFHLGTRIGARSSPGKRKPWR